MKPLNDERHPKPRYRTFKPEHECLPPVMPHQVQPFESAFYSHSPRYHGKPCHGPNYDPRHRNPIRPCAKLIPGQDYYVIWYDRHFKFNTFVGTYTNLTTEDVHGRHRVNPGFYNYVTHEGILEMDIGPHNLCLELKDARVTAQRLEIESMIEPCIHFILKNHIRDIPIPHNPYEVIVRDEDKSRSRTRVIYDFNASALRHYNFNLKIVMDYHTDFRPTHNIDFNIIHHKIDEIRIDTNYGEKVLTLKRLENEDMYMYLDRLLMVVEYTLRKDLDNKF